MQQEIYLYRRAKYLPIRIVAFPFRPLPRTTVLFFGLFLKSFEDGDGSHLYWNVGGEENRNILVYWIGFLSLFTHTNPKSWAGSISF